MDFRIVFATPVFHETAVGLQDSLQRLLAVATEVHSADSPSEEPWYASCEGDGVVNILIGANYMSHHPRPYVVYQMEQLESAWFTEAYVDALRNALCVWDFSQKNVDHWSASLAYVCWLPLHVPYDPIGRLLRCSRAGADGSAEILPVPEESQPLAVLFYGARNDRRERMEASFQSFARQCGIRVRFFLDYNLFGEHREMLIEEAQVVLNLHYYEGASLEVHRINYLLARGKCVVSERSGDATLDELYESSGALSFAHLRDFPDTVLALLRDPEARHRQECRAFNFMRRLADDAGPLRESLDLVDRAMRGV